jgi:hypothetical protein
MAPDEAPVRIAGTLDQATIQRGPTVAGSSSALWTDASGPVAVTRWTS